MADPFAPFPSIPPAPPTLPPTAPPNLDAPTGRMTLIPTDYLPNVGAPIPGSKPTGRGGRKGLLLGIGIGVLVLGILAGGYFAYSRGLIRIPFLSPKTDQLFDKFVSSLSEIKNAEYTVQATLAAEKRDPKATSIFSNANTNSAPVGLEGSRMKARDAQRKSDISMLRTALTLYYDDNNAYPPAITSKYLSTDPTSYVATIPTDPVSQEPYSYVSCSNNTHFVLSAQIEDTSVGSLFYITDNGNSGAEGDLPVCGNTSSGTNANSSPNSNSGQSSFFPALIPTALAQVNINSNANFTIDDTTTSGGPIGLGTSGSIPFLNSFGLDNYRAVLGAVPTDINASAHITLYSEADKALKDSDAILAIGGSYKSGDLTAEFDFEGRKIGQTVYGTLRKFPGIPYLSTFVDPLKGKWVKLEPGDGNDFLTTKTFEQANLRDGIEQTKRGLKSALDNKVFTVDKRLGSEMIAGVRSEHYRIALHPDKLGAAYQTVIDARKATNQDASDLEDLVKEVVKPETQQALQRIVDNSTLELWIDKVHGFLRQARWTIVLVPPEGVEKLKDRQYRIGVTLTLDKVNQKVAVGVPSGFITYDEAERLVTGVSKEEQQFNHQRERISNVKGAVGYYKTLSGAYPDTITDLPGQLKDALAKCKERQTNSNANGNTNGNTNIDNQLFVYYTCSEYGVESYADVNINDVYTGKPYGYTKDGTDYKLTYEMHPSFPKRTSTDLFSSSSSYYTDQYIDGTNTANSSDVSLEKETESEAANKRYEDQRKNSNTNTNSSIQTLSPVTAGEAVRGNANAAYALVEYGNYEGPYVAQFAVTMHEVMDHYDGQVKWVFRQFPLSIYPHDTSASLGAICVKSLGDGVKFWRYSETLLSTERTYGSLTDAAIATAAADAGIDPTDFASCKSSAATNTLLQADKANGTNVGVSGTPTTFLIDASGKILATMPGAQPLSAVTSYLDKYMTKSTLIKDTDKDGLSDDSEVYIYGTDPKKTDTDGDGYSDKTEIDGGYNPNGTGRL